MKKLITVVAMALVVSFTCGAAEKAAVKKTEAKKTEETKNWVADINSTKITLEDFNEKWDSIPEQYRSQYGFVGLEGKMKLLDTLIKNELVYQEGVKRGIDKKADIKKKLEDIRKQLIAEEVLRGEMDKLQVTDEEVKKFYNENKQYFGQPESVRVRHILVKTEDTANTVIAKLKGGADFEKLAKEYSEDPGTKEKGGDLGFFSRGQMVKEFEDAAFSLKIGEYTAKPVKTAYGYHILKMEEKKAESLKPLEEVKENVKTGALQGKQQTFMEEYLDALYKKAEVKKNLELLGN